PYTTLFRSRLVSDDSTLGAPDPEPGHPALQRGRLDPEDLGGALVPANSPADSIESGADVLPLPVGETGRCGGVVVLGAKRLDHERRSLGHDHGPLDHVPELAD